MNIMIKLLRSNTPLVFSFTDLFKLSNIFMLSVLTKDLGAFLTSFSKLSTFNIIPIISIGSNELTSYSTNILPI